MNKEKTEQWMKEHYPDLTNFENLQFVKDCAEDGVKKYKVELKRIIDETNIEIHKDFELMEEGPAINHWIDRFYKELISRLRL